MQNIAPSTSSLLKRDTQVVAAERFVEKEGLGGHSLITSKPLPPSPTQSLLARKLKEFQSAGGKTSSGD
jgi:hypothetical protein